MTDLATACHHLRPRVAEASEVDVGDQLRIVIHQIARVLGARHDQKRNVTDESGVNFERSEMIAHQRCAPLFVVGDTWLERHDCVVIEDGCLDSIRMLGEVTACVEFVETVLNVRNAVVAPAGIGVEVLQCAARSEAPNRPRIEATEKPAIAITEDRKRVHGELLCSLTNATVPRADIHVKYPFAILAPWQ